MTQNNKAGNDPRISLGIRKFLKELNSGDSKPMEEMEPEEARKVLEDAQASIEVDV